MKKGTEIYLRYKENEKQYNIHIFGQFLNQKN